MYTQQSPPHVWVHRHIATLPLKRKPFFINLMGPLQDHLWAMWVCLCHAPLSLLYELSFVPATWTFLLILQGLLVHAHSLHICSYFRDPCQAHGMNLCLSHSKDSHLCLHLAPVYPYDRDLCLCFCSIHHTAHHYRLWYYSLERLITWEVFLRSHNTACWNTIQPQSLSLWLWARLCYISHSHFLHLSNVGFNHFILTHVYLTIVIQHVLSQVLVCHDLSTQVSISVSDDQCWKICYH